VVLLSRGREWGGRRALWMLMELIFFRFPRNTTLMLFGLVVRGCNAIMVAAAAAAAAAAHVYAVHNAEPAGPHAARNGVRVCTASVANKGGRRCRTGLRCSMQRLSSGIRHQSDLIVLCVV
jgi:hypothetical protein